jgi:hypothetical protein
MSALPSAAATTLEEIVNETSLQLGPIFEQMEWAEDEIEQAQRRHPAQAALLWTTFRLMVPTQDLMGTEFVYRSHCRELLERVARRQDTRLGTAAELVIACSHTSQLAPLTTAGAGLYMRIWAKAFPTGPAVGGGRGRHDPKEARESDLMDDHEGVMRQKLSRPWRTLVAAPQQTELPL